jgi:ABC-type Fe3+/spermidine/putrescine transport system ATPase subunit
MSEAALSIKSVDKIYQGRGKGPVHAVKNLDMDVQRGEIVALLGSSGCGKTSTLRMIAGFEEVGYRPRGSAGQSDASGASKSRYGV